MFPAAQPCWASSPLRHKEGGSRSWVIRCSKGPGHVGYMVSGFVIAAQLALDVRRQPEAKHSG